MKKIGLLGASGSIGKQTLDIIRRERNFKLSFFSVHRNIDKAKKIIAEFSPEYAIITCEDAYKNLGSFYDSTKIYGPSELEYILKNKEVDIVVNAMMGMSGLSSSWWILNGGGKLALANKESLVSAGKLLVNLMEKEGGEILPVDSEHSALWQCMEGNNKRGIEKLILTASGGAFRDLTKNEMLNKNAKEALKHPNWSMGEKITIDSATMMNKGLEVIEAHWLFGVAQENIDVLIHRESVVHSLVQYKDGSLLAQLGISDMRQPIHYALHEKERMPLDLARLDLSQISQLHFEAVDKEKYPTLEYCYRALKEGGNRPLLLNTINEVLVEHFLNDKISLKDIFSGLYRSFDEAFFEPRDLQDLLDEEKRIRTKTEELCLQQ
ncbi:MAG TPA: 1-deoxy-D-xylulose-5-phosphate reductoisomerase [Clostridia bacterium]|nr:1-deoxy-D-xylulose-5-phosphate reductoisomerase [Clostridia bacterium]